MIIFVADIADDCILGCDFLSKTEITESRNKIFQNIPSTIDSNADKQGCCRIMEWVEELPDLLKDVFKKIIPRIYIRHRNRNLPSF